MVDEKDEKDRFGDKLRQKKKGDEDRYFAQRDKALLEKLKHGQSAAAPMRCPKDGGQLVPIQLHGVTVEECPTCHGLWFDAKELELVASRERDAWIGRFFYRPRI
jgi:Transcription factor zinc-finger